MTPHVGPFVPTTLRSFYEGVAERHKHILVARVNDHDVKVAVNEDTTEWHRHPDSDELFLTLEGLLEIEFEDGRVVSLPPGSTLLVPAGVYHRTNPVGRAVNLLVEHRNIETRYRGSASAD